MAKQLKLVYFLCPVCETLKSIPLAWLKKVKQPACSRRCQGILNGRRWAKHGHKGRAAWTSETEQRFKMRMSGTKNPNWRGGRSVNAAGYVELRMPEHPRARANGYVYEHLVVMEAALGRPLRKNEVVHHIDRNPSNNKPENLQVFTSNREHLEIAHGLPKSAKRAADQ